MRAEMPTLADLNNDQAVIQGLGAPMLAANGMLEPVGFESMRFLISGFTRPMITLNDPAQVTFGGGFETHVPGIPKTAYQMSVTFIETNAAHIAEFSEVCVQQGGRMKCWAYDGRPDNYTNRYLLTNVTFTFDGGGDIDSTNKSSNINVTATMYYNYFGLYESTRSGGGGLSGFLDKVDQVVSFGRKAANVVRGIKGLLGR